MPASDAFVVVQVTVLAVVFNLAIGVIAGVVTLATCDAWRRGSVFSIQKLEVDAAALGGGGGGGEDSKDVEGSGVDKVKIYRPTGPLFFAAIQPFANTFMPASDPERVAIDFKESRIVDFSALFAINKVFKR